MTELHRTAHRPEPLQAGVKLRGAEKVARIPVKILPTEDVPRKPDWIRVPIYTSPEIARIKALLRKEVLPVQLSAELAGNLLVTKRFNQMVGG